MIRQLLLMFFIIVITSCNNNADQAGDSDTTRLPDIQADPDVSIEEINKEDFYVWQVDNENKTKSLNPNLKEEYLQADTLITGLNEMFPRIKLEKVKVSNDTLYTMIKDSEHLTERMGSSGSELYIAQAIINLTAVPGINYVKIDFEEGSHASPDVWSKENFKDYKELQ